MTKPLWVVSYTDSLRSLLQTVVLQADGVRDAFRQLDIPYKGQSRKAQPMTPELEDTLQEMMGEDTFEELVKQARRGRPGVYCH